ncbi:MAG TPA: MBG domain-containing protein [Cytophagaceae bacterium]|nr:MBG domain-containing protein [Cytophagaceae bacterium]
MKSPSGITCDASGNIYVADNANQRIQEFTNAGVFISTWGVAGGNPISLALDASANVYVVQYQRVQKFTNSGTFLQRFGNDGTADGQLNQSFAAAMSSNGSVYVTDRGNNRIMVYNPDGTYQAKWGTLGTGNGQFTNLLSVSIDSVDNVYVGDETRIQKFTTSGTFITSFNAVANHIAFDAAGNIYTAGLLNNKIVKYSPTGTILLSLGSYGGGTGPGQFNSPMSIDLDSYGNIYVVELGNTRVQKLTPAGTYITSWGTTGPINEQLIGPYGMIVDDDNCVLVADPGSSNIKKYSSTGTFLTSFGNRGYDQGSFINPQSINKALNNKILIADPNKTNVQLFDRIKSNQTITFNTLTTKTYGASAFTLGGSSDSGLPLTYTSSDPTIASVSGNSVTILKVGTVTITASQPGNYMYNPAAINVSQTLTIGKAPLSVTADDKTRNTCSANPSLTYSISGFVNSETASVLSGLPTLSTTANGSSSAGPYLIQILPGTITSGNYSFNFINGTLQIVQSDVTITNSLPSSLCTGYSFDVIYSLCGSVNAGNVFKVQLSDISGTFGSPLEIGNLNSLSSGTINCTLPAVLTESVSYKARIISTNPSAIYAEYALPISILLSPAINTFAGSTVLCGNAQNKAFSVSSAESLTYLWTLPSTVTVSGALNQNSISLNFNSINSSEMIKVKGLKSNGCYSNEISSSITIQAFPAAPIFTGPSAVCEYDQNKIFSIPATAGSSYVWTNPAASTVNGAGNASQITLSFTNYTTGGALTVQEINSFGCVGALGSLNIAANLKPALTSITGNATPCGNAIGEAYSINTIAGVTYTWTPTVGGIIAAGQGTSSVTTNLMSGTNLSGTLSVQATNNATGCINSDSKTLTYKAFPSFTGANSIVGPLVACSISQQLSFYPAPNDGNTLLWTIPSYAHFVNAGDATYAFPNIVLDQYKTLPVTLTIFRTSTGCSTSRTVIVDTANFNPVIVGPDYVCDVPSPTYLTNSYSVVNIPGATYLWSKGANQANATTSLNQSSVSFQFQFANGSPISLTMTYKGCQKTVTQSVSRKGGTYPYLSISGPEFVCNNAANSLVSIPVTFSLNNKKSGYIYKWSNQYAPVFTGNAFTMNVKPVVDFQTASSIIVTEVDPADGCYVSKTDKTIKGYKGTPFPYGNTSFCADTSSQVISVINPNPLSSYQWDVSSGVNIISGTNTSNIKVKFDAGTSVAYYGVLETNEIGCISNKGVFAASSQSGRYSSSDAEISCASSDFIFPVQAPYLPSNLNKIEFCFSYNTQYFSLNTTMPYTLVNLAGSTVAPLTVNVTETTPGQIIFTAQSATGTTLKGNDYLFNMNLIPNFTNFVPGTVTNISSCFIRETQTNGTISNCYSINAQIKSRAVNTSLHGTLVRTRSGLDIPLGYDSFTPSKYLPTVIAGSSSSACTGLTSAFYPDINGKFTYDPGAGSFLYLNRGIPASTNVATYINSMDVYHLNLLLQGYGGLIASGLEMFDLLAADVNQDSKLDNADVNGITVRSFGGSFNQVNGLNRDWIFVRNSDLSLPAFNKKVYAPDLPSGQIKYDPATSLPVIPTCQSIITKTNSSCTDIPDEIYHGVLLGDLDFGSSSGYFLNQPNTSMRMAAGNTLETASIKVDLSSSTVLSNGNLQVPIMVFASDTGLTFDLQLDYDQSKISIVDITAGSAMIDSILDFSWIIFQNSELRLMGYITDSIRLLSNYPLLYAEVNLNGNPLSTSLFGTSKLALINGLPAEGIILNATIATSVNKGNILESVALHPNPSSGLVTVSGISANYDYSIKNSLGTEVRREENLSVDQIDFKELADGVYYLTISSSGLYKTFKIVKLN